MWKCRFSLLRRLAPAMRTKGIQVKLHLLLLLRKPPFGNAEVQLQATAVPAFLAPAAAEERTPSRYLVFWVPPPSSSAPELSRHQMNHPSDVLGFWQW